MGDLLFASATAFWLGILTAISPCPLATTVAAISYVGRRAEHPRLVLLAGLLYSAGRVLMYVALAGALIGSVLSISQISFFLQHHLNKILGPLLIVVGMFLLDLLTIRRGGPGMSAATQKRIERLGLFGALPLGMLFAVSFCPISAVIFFGSLIPLAMNYQSTFALPIFYGIGTALPVLIFALLLAFGAHWIAKVFHRISKAELWLRRATGCIFVGIGIYFSIIFIFLAR